jgi:hypothetical protein
MQMAQTTKIYNSEEKYDVVEKKNLKDLVRVSLIIFSAAAWSGRFVRISIKQRLISSFRHWQFNSTSM